MLTCGKLVSIMRNQAVWRVLNILGTTSTPAQAAVSTGWARSARHFHMRMRFDFIFV